MIAVLIGFNQKLFDPSFSSEKKINNKNTISKQGCMIRLSFCFAALVLFMEGLAFGHGGMDTEEGFVPKLSNTHECSIPITIVCAEKEEAEALTEIFQKGTALMFIQVVHKDRIGCEVIPEDRRVAFLLRKHMRSFLPEDFWEDEWIGEWGEVELLFFSKTEIYNECVAAMQEWRMDYMDYVLDTRYMDIEGGVFWEIYHTREKSPVRYLD